MACLIINKVENAYYTNEAMAIANRYIKEFGDNSSVDCDELNKLVRVWTKQLDYI